MIPKFRAYDNGSLSRMYQSDEVMVCDGNIWIIDEDSSDGEWLVNNDLVIMQSTGLFDKNGKEIFEGDIVTDGRNIRDIKHHQVLGFYMLDAYGYSDLFAKNVDVEYFEEFSETVSKTFRIIGNIYENPDFIEVEE